MRHLFIHTHSVRFHPRCRIYGVSKEAISRHLQSHDACHTSTWGRCMWWWRHQMETFSAFLALCAGNSPVTGEFPAQRPETRSFDVFFDLRLNKRLSKQSWGWWFETPSWSLWRHCNVMPLDMVGYNISGHTALGNVKKSMNYVFRRKKMQRKKIYYFPRPALF